ncbi:tRNA 2-selenouridine(34) synthase MnmH [Isachenkonia alkalipeptolytica]|uniref:tRNA 2-selenouridine(34) synthase MnmH n=1 Tax=Isachenkonia alkalipeptolytica TaxID=2565777 RepID=A0AA43XHK4_9CLOT|nr:tRNA 2-selenouridine(34) synthase MnmH [Isachenkonia alkalipeptolytica]NBG86987.1 tRNA 2-selenouridine(34) synthase MnmH [Isachenkonia alkalipeptolytica]
MKTVTIEKVLPEKRELMIDLRTPKEFEEDHIPGAQNFPILTNEERHVVGTLYKKDPDRAKNLALVYGQEKLEALQQKIRVFSNSGREVIFYCYRGGMRSGLLVKHLDSLGYPAVKLEGGYKSYRNFVRRELSAFGKRLNFVVLHGYTGVGKTRILNLLQEKNLPVLDLEGLAQNSGSVFGEIMYSGKTPSQKYFESRIYSELSSITESHCFVEMESRRIGKVTVPEELYHGLVTSSHHVLVNTSLKNRIDTIYQDYVGDHELSREDLAGKFQRLKRILGKEKVEILIRTLENRDYKQIIETLILDYYDPLYRKSLKNYRGKMSEFTYEDLSKDLFAWLDGKNFTKD